MNAGKSTRLIQESFNYEESGKHVLRFTYGSDHRFENEIKIASRIQGFSVDAITFENLDLFDYVMKFPLDYEIAAIFVDEAQFLTEKQVDELADIVDNFNIPVMCYGIRTDFKSNLFPGSKRLLAIADKLEEVKSICACEDCHTKATMVLRLDGSGKIVHDGKQIEIGANDRYVSVCRRHYNLMMRAKSNEPYLLSKKYLDNQTFHPDASK